MAVVTIFAGSAKSPSSADLIPAVLAEGRMRVINIPTTTVTNGNSATSLFYVGKIASNAVPLAGLSTLKHGAITGASDVDIGLYKDGAAVDIDIFADALTLAAAGVKDPFASIGVADAGKQIWQLLGLSKDPGVEYDIALQLKADATATATFSGHMVYSKK
ncbi:hypothetical protein ONR75_24065 [Rhodopseudomonas sp. P2A-2r]|uniref:hypothetical protein n=1 Tax=Rhodopseudomonas sp. P2A-2r TaxID=2991972 RepID=UPI002234B732|nr:hypothetical protein [Rhodopseudomonas sp. P2A-2r]UZE47915.1 hypothetical protein ONR75_24065 [Rhodopseudomonas sp. P2A-2r]